MPGAALALLAVALALAGPVAEAAPEAGVDSHTVCAGAFPWDHVCQASGLACHALADRGLPPRDAVSVA